MNWGEICGEYVTIYWHCEGIFFLWINFGSSIVLKVRVFMASEQFLPQRLQQKKKKNFFIHQMPTESSLWYTRTCNYSFWYNISIITQYFRKLWCVSFKLLLSLHVSFLKIINSLKKIGLIVIFMLLSYFQYL